MPKAKMKNIAVGILMVSALVVLRIQLKSLYDNRERSTQELAEEGNASAQNQLGYMYSQ